MSKKTITKKIAFVIFMLLLGSLFFGCHSVTSSRQADTNRSRNDVSIDYESPKILGIIKSDEITESSGLVASKCQENVFWTHNDSGDGAFIFAINSKGEKLGVWKVKDANNRDWEDLATIKDASGECFLYIGDIGNNDLRRDNLTIYRVKEPSISDADKNSTRKNLLITEDSQAFKIEYPNENFDAETLMVHPQTGDIYILTKSFKDPARVYKLSNGYNLKTVNQLEKISDLTVPSIPNGFLTGGDISSDGKRVIISDYLAGYELILPEKAKNFDDIWREKPLIVDLGEREQGEAICYAADGSAIYATSEKLSSPVIEIKRK